MIGKFDVIDDKLVMSDMSSKDEKHIALFYREIFKLEKPKHPSYS